MNRYQWQTTSSQQHTVQPEAARHQLFDVVTGQPIVVISEIELGWKWERRTNYLLHRAHPAAGIAATLEEAQAAAVKDLPLEE
jgi:hypothetical protein